MEVLERLELRGDETVLDAGCGSRPGHRASWSSGCPTAGVIAVDGSEAMIEKARERLRRRRRPTWSPTSPSWSCDEPVDAGLLDRDLPLDRSTTTGSSRRLHAALRAGRAPGRPVRRRGQRRRARRRRSPRSPPRPEFAPHFEGIERRCGTSPRPRRPRRGCARAGFAEARCWLRAEAGHAARPAASSSRPSRLGPHLARLPEELREPFAEAVLEPPSEPLRARLRAPQHRGRRR